MALMMLLERASSLNRLPCPKTACRRFAGMLRGFSRLWVQTPIHITLSGAHHPEDGHRGKSQGYFGGEVVVFGVLGATHRDAPQNLMCMEREPGCSGKAGSITCYDAESSAML